MLTPQDKIKEMTIPWLFQELRASKKTGTALFEQDKRVKKVYFIKGDILFASSNSEDERLGEFLLRQGRITREQFESASASVIKTGKKLGAVLYELGILSPKELVVQVKLQIKHIILELFKWREGSYRFDEGQPDADQVIPLQMSTGSLILEGVHGVEWQVVRKRIPPLRTVLRPSPDPSLIFQQADLSADEKTVLAFVDGSRNLEQLCALTGIGDFNTLKAVYLLLALRIIEPGELSPGERKRFAHYTVPEAANSAGKRPDPPVVVTKQMIMDAFAAMKKQDDFQVLGINASTAAPEIKKAYFRLAKLYHPDRHFEPEMSDMKEKLEALFTRIHDAYQVLSDDNRQQRSEQGGDGQKSSGHFEEKRAEDYVENYAEKAASAAAYYSKGMIEFNIGNYWGAAESLAWAIRLDPVKAAYFHQYGLSLMHIPRRRHEAEENLQKAIEIDPLRPEYHLELGKLYMKSGLKTKAVDVYSVALRENPNWDVVKEALLAASGTLPKMNEGESGGLFNKIFRDKK